MVFIHGTVMATIVDMGSVLVINKYGIDGDMEILLGYMAIVKAMAVM